tara:strand:- start:2732 stop:3295 length:564 start_codon:yes stop_codon:yes gene_type:complete
MPACGAFLRHLEAMTRTITLCLWLIASAGVSAAPLYVWTDAKGIRHYSDRAVSGASRLDEPAVRTPRPTQAEASSSAPQSVHAPRILSPVSNATIEQGQAGVMISVSVPDGLGPDEELVYRLDGRELDTIAPRTTRLAVERLEVGRHELDVTLVDHDTPTGRRDRVVFDVAPPGDPSASQADARPPS